MNTTRQLRIYLFDSFRLLRNGIEISAKDWYTRQARQLFKVLLTERGHMVLTHRLVNLLWPEYVENAHKTLRSAVSALRDVLEPDREPWFSSSFVPRGQAGYALVFPTFCSVWIDVVEFENLLDANLDGENTATTRAGLEAALQLYTGDYLSADGDPSWVLAERARLRDRYFAGVLCLMKWWGALHCYNEAIELGQHALELDTCYEPLCRLTMQYQVLVGNNAAALHTFERCRRALDEQMGADPSAQTLALHMAILKGEFPVPQQVRSIELLSDDLSRQGKQQVKTNWLAQQLVETQEQALHYTMQAADYARRTFSYRLALADYDAAAQLLQVQEPRQERGSGLRVEWGRVYHGRGLVYEALLDWPGIQENYQNLSNWAALQHDSVLAKGIVQRMMISRSLMGYVPEALGMGRELLHQLQRESEKQFALPQPTRESLRLLVDIAQRWEHIMSLDEPWDRDQTSVLSFAPFCAVASPEVCDWDQAIEVLGPAQSACVLTFYGWMLFLQGLSAETERCLQAALQAAQATGQVTWEILASLHLSRTYAFCGHRERAKQEFARCLELCQQISEAEWVTIWPWLNRAYALLDLKRLDEAEQIFLQVQRQPINHDMPSNWCSTQIGLGLLALARRQFAQAHHLLSEALEQRQSVYIEVYVLAQIGLAEIAQHQGASTEAYERLCRILAFCGKRSLLQLYATSALALARLSLHTHQNQGIAALLETVCQLATDAGSQKLASECRVLQTQF